VEGRIPTMVMDINRRRSMRRTTFIAAAALGVLGLGLLPGSATACLTCTSTQLCSTGDQGSNCFVYEDEQGRRWCQFSTDCGIEMALNPLHISPAGTYLAAADTRLVDDRAETRACNGFIVGHLADAPAPSGTGTTIRI
jgi:hypothetical protein